MKKIAALLLGFALVSTAGFAFMKDAKIKACKQGCESAYKDCVKEAKDDTTAAAACEVKKVACLKGCDEAK